MLAKCLEHTSRTIHVFERVFKIKYQDLKTNSKTDRSECVTIESRRKLEEALETVQTTECPFTTMSEHNIRKLLLENWPDTDRIVVVMQEAQSHLLSMFVSYIGTNS